MLPRRFSAARLCVPNRRLRRAILCTRSLLHFCVFRYLSTVLGNVDSVDSGLDDWTTSKCLVCEIHSLTSKLTSLIRRIELGVTLKSSYVKFVKFLITSKLYAYAHENFRIKLLSVLNVSPNDRSLFELLQVRPGLVSG